MPHLLLHLQIVHHVKKKTFSLVLYRLELQFLHVLATACLTRKAHLDHLGLMVGRWEVISLQKPLAQ